MANNGGAIIGYAAFGFLADAYGRKPVTIAYVVLAFLLGADGVSLDAAT